MNNSHGTTNNNNLISSHTLSVWLMDDLYFYLNSPLSIIGSLLNLINFIAFQRIKFPKSRLIFHQYLKIYSLFSLFICLIILFNSLAAMRYYLDNDNHYWIRFYRCKIFTWFTTMLVQYLNLLDCVLLFERLTFIGGSNTIRMKKFFTYNSYFVCFILFLICNLINLPSYFFLLPRNEQTVNDLWSFENKLISYCERNAYFTESNGRIFVYLVILFRDILTILIEIGLAILSVVSFRKYIEKITLLPNNESRRARLFKKAELYNLHLTKMTWYLSLLSIFSHIGFFTCYVLCYININDPTIFLSLILISFIFINLKYTSNLYLFYHFNEKFRDYFNRRNNIIYNKLLFGKWKVKISFNLYWFRIKHGNINNNN